MKKTAPSLEDLFAVVSSVSFGQGHARVPIPDEPQLEDTATRLGVALNVLLDDLSTRARATEQMADRLRILAEAAREFSTTTQDHELLVSTVARRLAEVMKDVCMVRLLSEDGRALVPVAIHANDDEARNRARAAFSEPLVLEEHPLSRRVHESGEPFVAPKLDLEGLRAHTTAADFQYAKETGIHSCLIVPLRVQGRSIGQLVLHRYRPESPSFDEHDKNLACALADHAAIAIANSRSYAAERDARAAAERARYEAEQARALVAAIVQSSHDAILSKRLDGTITSWNGAAERLFGYSGREAVGQSISILVPPDRVDEERTLLGRVAAGDRVDRYETIRRHKDGHLIAVSVSLAPISDALGNVVGVSKTARDLTSQHKGEEALRRAEEQLRHSQKMEAVGRLAGGVAHDFNNVLSVILSYGEMLLGELKPGEPMRDDVEEIRKAATRAADLTRQLLMFSRQQVLEPKVLDLNDVLTSMDKMLQRILGADVDLVSRAAQPLGRVRVDPSSIEQVIMNLVVNARDAMPTGGKLTMETDNVVLDGVYARAHLGVTPGPHVMLAITDTGAGMDKATLSRIFEPFFTTKEAGKGTGLGLSTVFGIVQQSGGSVWVYTEPGKGTTFKVYLPRVDDAVDVVRPSAAPTSMRGSETILLVEDDDQLRAVARSILGRNGYLVIEARNAGEALLHSERHPGTIHLLLSDVVMPQMSGPELAKRLASSRPDMKVLCMSGYTDDSIVRHGVLEARIAYLQKPITPDMLTTRVREVLDGRSGRSA